MGHGACSGHWSGFISDSDRSQRRGLDEWVVTSLRQNRMRAKSRRFENRQRWRHDSCSWRTAMPCVCCGDVRCCYIWYRRIL